MVHASATYLRKLREGGPIALVKEGDIIDIDVPARKLDLKVSEEGASKRREMFKPPEKKVTGYLARYRKYVSSASKGAIFE